MENAEADADADAIELNFDPLVLKKKKKKKKKVPFGLDAMLGLTDDNPPKEPEATEAAASTACPEAPIEDEQLDLEYFGKKKKKKKKQINLDDLDAVLPSTSQEAGMKYSLQKKAEIGAASETAKVASKEIADDEFDLNMDFSMSKKKKKAKKKDVIFDGEKLDDEKIVDTETEDDSGNTWLGSDRDYTYDELLKRVFDTMLEKNPDMAAGRKPKFVMRPPQVLRVGSKKTSFANFMDIAKTLHRMPKHLLDFLLAELGTSGSMDGNQQLIIKGRFQAKQIENVLRRYIKEYVTCHTCRSPETILQKDTRIFFLQCESCGSRCSVASIKSGFQAVTGKRAAIRAKTT